MKSPLLSLLVSLSLLTACGAPQASQLTSAPSASPSQANVTSAVNFIQQPAYSLSSNSESQLKPELTAQAESDRCTTLEYTTSFAGGLTPSLPIARCVYFSFDTPASINGLFAEENTNNPMRARYSSVWYYLRTAQGLETLADAAAFRQHFAPVESEAEALAFVLALHQVQQIRKSAFQSDIQWQVTQQSETLVKKTAQGFVVEHVLQGGCSGDRSLEPGYDVSFEVSQQGEITELSRKKILDQNCPVA